MENAADALKMAAAVLAFVLALGISISSFSEVREVSQVILNYKDKEYNYTYIPENGKTTRNVSVETIVQSIYRAYNENYKIYFYKNGNESDPLTIFQENTTPKKDINYIDLRSQALASVEKRNQFIGCILYGRSYRDPKGKNFDSIKNDFKEIGILLQDEGLYDKIISSGSRGGVEEKFGVYYEDDEKTENSIPDESQSKIPQANRIKKRVITYILK